MADRRFGVLFLCTGNSARSVMAEAALGRWGADRFDAHSAGSHPRGEVHPMTLRVLQDLRYDTSRFRSKSWNEFARPEAPHLDFVFTVCDSAANEVCPVWPGQPMTAHWGIEDPAAFVGDEQATRRAFLRAYTYLESRIKLFTALPFNSLSALTLQARVDEIGRMRDAGEAILTEKP